MEVEVIEDYPVDDHPQEEFIFLSIYSLAASDGTAPPRFRESLGPAPPSTPEDHVFSSPLSPDPYEDNDSSDESIISVDPLRWEEEDMSTDEDAESGFADEDSPRSPSPEPLPYDEAEGYYLTYYQWSLLLVNTTRHH